MLFSGDEVYKPAKVLSGGEKGTLYAQPYDDDPRQCAAAGPAHQPSGPGEHPGAGRRPGALSRQPAFSSHDHQFIDEIANRIIELPLGEPGCLDRTGTYEEFLEWKHNR